MKKWRVYSWMPVRWMGRQTGPMERQVFKSALIEAPNRKAAIAEFHRLHREGGRRISAQVEKAENPAIRAQVRRLPSGEVQIKVPLKRGENPLAKAQQLAKALGRKITSVARAGTGNPSSYEPDGFGVYEWSEVTRSSYPWLKKYTVATYRKGEKIEPDMRLVRIFQSYTMAGKYADKLEREWKKGKANPQPRKLVGGYYQVGDFYIGKAPIPMPRGQAWAVYTREGQVVGRAGSMQAAVKKANQYLKRGVVIEQ